MASPAQWTWVWVNSRSWWWTGRPGVLQSVRSQRVRHDLVTEPQQREASLSQLSTWLPPLGRVSGSVTFDSLWPHGLCSLPGSSLHGTSQAKNTVVGCCFPLQGILPTQGSNPGLLRCRQTLLTEPPPRVLTAASGGHRGCVFSNKPDSWAASSVTRKHPGGGFSRMWSEGGQLHRPRPWPWHHTPYAIPTSTTGRVLHTSL